LRLVQSVDAHWPFESHDCWALPEHCVCPGAQLPTHVPETHVWLTHGFGAPHMPLEQDCTPFPEHCTWPAVHVPVHAPFMHFSPFGHGESVHCPLESHVWTPVPVPSHCTAIGSHTPHWFPEQTEASQGTADPQLPAGVHVCTPPPASLGAHCVVPGAHMPVQTAKPASFTSHT
jgi:hypothetical protein